MSMQNSYTSKREEKGKNIQVVVRCRPFNVSERKANSHNVIDCESVKKEVAVRTSGPGSEKGAKKYTFDMVFGPSAKQIDVYRSVVYPILDEVIMGYNCTIFAYGQTGSGKTFTMEGERSQNEQYTWEEDPLAGVIPRTLHQIFEKLAAQGTEFSVKVSLLEIYNEELFDLLSPSPDVSERLQMFDDPRNKRGVIIKGLEEISVHNKDEVYQILERGAAKRRTAATLMNAYSSRSHSVFSITIHMKETTLDGEELVKIGKLNLVDLAGSENIGRSGAVDKRAREAGNINQSLLTLGRVITALVERTPHVPYRESKLTRILQDSLGGRTKTSIIATISPASINVEETLSTLDYACRAKNIMNKPEVNQKLTKKALIKEYTEEIERLKRDLASAREKNGVYISAESYEAMQSKLTVQEEFISDYMEKISVVEEELKRVNELFVDNKKEFEECVTQLQNKEQVLQETEKDLEITKNKLAEEQFVLLAHVQTEENLYDTANELLQSVQDSTKDVSGLHAKLDRKKTVEFHNCKVQESFEKKMDDLFNEMQQKMDEHHVKQQGMLDIYTESVGDLLSSNATAFGAMTSTVVTSFASIKETVSSEVSRSLHEMLKQDSLTAQSVNGVQRIMEEHKVEMEKALKKNLLPLVASVFELNKSLKLTLQSHCGLVTKMITMKDDMNEFFGEQSEMLSKLRETTCDALGVIQEQNQKMNQELQKAQQDQIQGVSSIISSLQSQLALLTQQTQKNFSCVQTRNENIYNSIATLQDNVQLQSAKAIESTASHQGKFINSAESYANEIEQIFSDGLKTVDQSNVQCEKLSSSMQVLCQKSLHWCDSTSDVIESFRQEQMSFLVNGKRRLQDFEQDLNKSCDSLVIGVERELKTHHEAEESALSSLFEQVNSDQGEMNLRVKKLSEQAQAGLKHVNCFLTEELKEDVPTGTTPKRRDYSYSQVLQKTEPRDYLIDQFRKQQEEEPHITFNTDVFVQEESVSEQIQAYQDLLEDDQVSIDGDSVTSNISEKEANNMYCGDGSVPFFQHKKGNRKDKENKTNLNIDKVKSLVDSLVLSSSKSKLPLRIQN
uniref:Kinesin family member 11 n=1 Tax=Callorhinchus milii TaxID=7868 RepID=A0A4W3KDR3_CALMI|eukprot:gi/632936390/ref/XP_007894725.1/ PREDICTED: kinesin-like protein KIF11 [Callorhinchus milii]